MCQIIDKLLGYSIDSGLHSISMHWHNCGFFLTFETVGCRTCIDAAFMWCYVLIMFTSSSGCMHHKKKELLGNSLIISLNVRSSNDRRSWIDCSMFSATSKVKRSNTENTRSNTGKKKHSARHGFHTNEKKLHGLFHIIFQKFLATITRSLTFNELRPVARPPSSCYLNGLIFNKKKILKWNRGRRARLRLFPRHRVRLRVFASWQFAPDEPTIVFRARTPSFAKYSCKRKNYPNDISRPLFCVLFWIYRVKTAKTYSSFKQMPWACFSCAHRYANGQTSAKHLKYSIFVWAQ